MNIKKITVINLRRRPDRLEKTKKFLTLAKAPNYDIFYGYDGLDYKHTTDMMKLLDWGPINKSYLSVASWIDETRYWCKAKLGNILSHAKILKDFSISNASDDDWLIVLEDDIVLSHPFSILMKNLKEYILKYPDHEFIVLSDRTGIAEKFLGKEGIRGTDAYILTKKMASFLYPKLNLSRDLTPYHQMSMDLIYYHLSLYNVITIGCLALPWAQNLNKGFPRDSDIEQ
jgi:GR25 family glycosyltransferase involved in LPS biosynthesis